MLRDIDVIVIGRDINVIVIAEGEADIITDIQTLIMCELLVFKVSMNISIYGHIRLYRERTGAPWGHLDLSKLMHLIIVDPFLVRGTFSSMLTSI